MKSSHDNHVLLHLNQKTEYEPSVLSTRLPIPSSFCVLPKGSVKSVVSFSEIGPISCFDTGTGGLNKLGSGCRMAKMLLFDLPTIRRRTSCRLSYNGHSVSRYRAATGSHGLHGSSMSMHDLAYARSASTPSVWPSMSLVVALKSRQMAAEKDQYILHLSACFTFLHFPQQLTLSSSA